MRAEAENQHIIIYTSVSNYRHLKKKKCTALRSLSDEPLPGAISSGGMGGPCRKWERVLMRPRSTCKRATGWRRPWDSDLSHTCPAEGWPVARGRQDDGKRRDSCFIMIENDSHEWVYAVSHREYNVNGATWARTT